MKKILLSVSFAITIMASPAIIFGASVIPLNDSTKTSVPVTINPSDVLKNAIADFKNLSRSERRDRIRDAKKAIHEYKVAKRAHSEPSTSTLLLVILAIILPPLAVYLYEGTINGKFWLSLILTLLFFIPGVVYALIVVLGKKS